MNYDEAIAYIYKVFLIVGYLGKNITKVSPKR